MSAPTPALLAAAAGVGFGHAILPDHWVPLAVLGRSRHFPLSRIARLSLLAAITHVLLSLILGGAIIAIGLQFRSTIQSAQDTIVGCLLVATGLGFGAFELSGHGHSAHGHSHHTDGHEDSHHETRDPGHRHERHHSAGEGRGLRGLAAVIVPFGAAASPDLTILPVFLAAAAVSTGTAVGSLFVFATVTIATIVGLTLAAAKGGYEIRGQWLDRWGNHVTAVTLIVIGALVLTGTI